MKLNKRALIFFLACVAIVQTNEVEVSSDAAAAIKQHSDGQKQTFISSQSKAKTGKDLALERLPEQEAGQRSNPIGPTDDPRKDLRWGYSDSTYTYSSDKWAMHYPICNGSKQSPVPLQAEPNKLSGKFMNPLKLETTDRDGVMFGNLINDGHTFGMRMNENRSSVTIHGGPLENDNYSLYQLHFHFSCDNKESGSEHSMDGLKYTAELHLVFYNKKYSAFQDAVDKPDGLAVLGFFIKSGVNINYGTFLINRYLIDISNPVSTVNVAYGLSIFDLLRKMHDGAEHLNYVTYTGSLTTPPCYESVTWIVFQEPIKVPLRDIESWRRLNGYNGAKLCNNYRPLQTINERQMHFVNPTKVN